MEYNIDCSCVCDSTETRLQLQNDLIQQLRNKLSISRKHITIESEEETLSVSWEGKGKFESLRQFLLRLASEYSVCFEIEFTNDEISSGSIFLGVGAIDAEVEYLLEEVRSLAHRMSRRVDLIAAKLEIPEKEVQRSVSIFLHDPHPKSKSKEPTPVRRKGRAESDPSSRQKSRKPTTSDDSESTDSSEDRKRQKFERMEKARHEREQQERDRQEREQQERDRQEREQQERDRQEREQQERDRQEREQQERERHEREQQERERHEREQQERERHERDRMERERQEREHQERERKERERHDQERLMKERIETDRLEKDRIMRENKKSITPDSGSSEFEVNHEMVSTRYRQPEIETRKPGTHNLGPGMPGYKKQSTGRGLNNRRNSVGNSYRRSNSTTITSDDTNPLTDDSSISSSKNSEITDRSNTTDETHFTDEETNSQ